MGNTYSPHTGEHIHTDDPAPWMLRATEPAPQYNPSTHSCFWRGGEWVLKEAHAEDLPVPDFCTGPQGQLALLELGKYHAARAYIDGIQDPAQKLRAEIEWMRPTWERANPFLQAIWAALGGTPEGLDDAFRLAVTL